VSSSHSPISGNVNRRHDAVCRYETEAEHAKLVRTDGSTLESHTRFCGLAFAGDRTPQLGDEPKPRTSKNVSPRVCGSTAILRAFAARRFQAMPANPINQLTTRRVGRSQPERIRNIVTGHR